MRSVISCFNVTLYKKNLARFWPLWALYTLAWLLVLPISLLVELTQRSAWELGFDAALWASAWAIQSPVTRMASGFGLAMAVVYGVLVLALGAVTRQDVLDLPKGEKIARMLHLH